MERLYLTFGSDHAEAAAKGDHPLPAHWVSTSGFGIIEAPTYRMAHAIAHAITDSRFAFDYPERIWEGKGHAAKWYPDGPAFRITYQDGEEA